MLPYDTTIYVARCTGDRHLYKGKYYSKDILLTDSMQTITSCDSIIYMDIRFYDHFEEIRNDTLCLYKDLFYEFNGKHLTGSDIYKDTLVSVFGCDSILMLDLVVYEPLVILLSDSFPEICADAGNYTYEYELLSGDFDNLQMTFDDDAIRAGFADIIHTRSEVTLGTIFINLPPDIKPDIYNATLTFRHQYHGYQEFNISLRVSYPRNIVEQKWNDVLAVLNSRFNGGYEFIAFQWYKNGVPIPESTKSYLYVENRLDFDSKYSVKLTRLEDNVSAFTCPFEPQKQIEVGVYPTLLSLGQSVTVETTVGGKAVLWDIMGIKIKEYNIDVNINNLQIPNKTGTYYLSITTDDGDMKTYSIMVK